MCLLFLGLNGLSEGAPNLELPAFLGTLQSHHRRMQRPSQTPSVQQRTLCMDMTLGLALFTTARLEYARDWLQPWLFSGLGSQVAQDSWQCTHLVHKIDGHH